MDKTAVFKSLNLSVVPFKSDYLFLLADEIKSTGADGLAIVCGDRFPWNSPSRIPAGECYDEQEIAALVDYCSKIKLPCVPALLQSDLGSILSSLKGFEKYSRMDSADLKIFYHKLISEFTDDVLSLFNDADKMLFCVDGDFCFDELPAGTGVDFIRFDLSALSASAGQSESAIPSDDGRILLHCGYGPVSGRQNFFIFPSLAAEKSMLYAETTENEKIYTQLVSDLDRIAGQVCTADIHSRTGSRYPVTFWEELLAALENLEKVIPEKIKANRITFSRYIAECWLERRMYSEQKFHEQRIRELAGICSQHLYR